MAVDIYPPSQPSGMTIGYAEVTANQATITTEVDLTGLTVTVTVPAGRRIRITGQSLWNSGSSSPTINMRIKEGATELNEWQVTGPAAIGNGFSTHIQATVLPTAGTHTYKLTGSATASSTMLAGATFPAFILVEDVTGTIYPAGTLVTAGIIASEQWTNYIPVITQTGTVTYTATYARYLKMGRTITVQLQLSITGSGTGASGVLVTLPPFTPVTNNQLAGVGEIIDSSAGTAFRGLAKVLTSGSVFFVPTETTVNNTLGNTSFTAGLASGDLISCAITYEATS